MITRNGLERMARKLRRLLDTRGSILSNRILDAIRRQPCKNCGAPPPNETHRSLPGFLSGRYSSGNVIPLCNKCHHTEHKNDECLPTKIQGIIRHLVNQFYDRAERRDWINLTTIVLSQRTLLYQRRKAGRLMRRDQQRVVVTCPIHGATHVRKVNDRYGTVCCGHKPIWHK